MAGNERLGGVLEAGAADDDEQNGTADKEGGMVWGTYGDGWYDGSVGKFSKAKYEYVEGNWTGKKRDA